MDDTVKLVDVSDYLILKIIDALQIELIDLFHDDIRDTKHQIN